MYIQAAIVALDECAKNIDEFDRSFLTKPVGQGATIPIAAYKSVVRNLKSQALMGIAIVKRLLEEEPAPEANEKCEVHVVQVDGSADAPDIAKKIIEQLAGIDIPPHCPRCGNEEISPETKFCKICGLPIMQNASGRTDQL